ncbi:integrase [Streptomyces sp. NPDC001046]|uniref:integrase n=1 Tax=Streptomyces sp. NPDC001046 TaxID=3364543 RepID=UPI00368FA7F0
MTHPLSVPLDLAAETPIIQPDRVVAEYTGPIARYDAPVWPLDPLIANPSAARRRIHWASFPLVMQPELRFLTYQMINTELPEKLLIGRHPAWRTRQSPGAIYMTCRIWAGFSRWLATRSVLTLAACTPELFRKYSDELVREGGLTRNSVQYHLIALIRLWAFDTCSPHPIGICEPPWSHEGIDDYLPPATSGGENATEPITPDTMGPLLIWALRMVEDFAPDILAAWAENRRLRTQAQHTRASARSRAALDAYLNDLAARGAPLPTIRQPGRLVAAGTYIAGLTGATAAQVTRRIKEPKWARYRDENPGPAPLPTPIWGRIDDRPWTETIDFTEAAGLMRHLGTACFIVLSYLTGQRPGETLSLRTGCCPHPGAGRPLIYGHVFKTARDEDGNHLSRGRMREVPWVAIRPAMRAVRVLERMVPADSLLFGATAHDFPHHRTYHAALNRPTMNRRIEDFISWSSALALRLGRPHEVIPDDPHGAIGTERFRRTLAWHIARRPGGLVALAIQYGHMRTAVSAGYAARSRDGIHDLLDIETARATADTLATLHADLDAGVGVSGPAARRAIHAATQAPSFAGSIRSTRQARAILRNPTLAVHDNPHTFLMCVYNRDKALCHRVGTSDTPTLDRCVSACANIARTDRHATQLRAEAEHLEKQAASEMVPEPLADRLRQRADNLRDFADQHHRNRIANQERTTT